HSLHILPHLHPSPTRRSSDLTVDEVIDTAGAQVPIRIHRPTAEAILPGIVFLHGGGFTVGDLDTHDRIMRVIAAESGAAVIGVEDRKSTRLNSSHVSISYAVF